MTASVAAPDRDAGLDETAASSVVVELVATLALAVFSAIVGASLIRIYGDWSFFPDVVVLIAVGHGLAFVLRRTPLPSFAAITMSLVAVAVVAVRIVHPETMAAAFPTGASWRALTADFRFLGDEFATATTPVPYAGGWALLGVLGVAAVVWLGDAFAFTARGRGEALVPGAVVFVFVAALGTERDATELTLALVAAGVLAVAALRANFAAPPRTTLGRRRASLMTMGPAAVMVGAVVVLSAWAVGPRLPGADDEPWVDTRGQGGGGVTEVISPLVDIRSRLVDQSDTEMLTVAATTGANWRVSTLAQFDGTTWGLPQRPLRSAGGELNDPRPGSTPNQQLVTIAALGGRLVPAAADPVHVEGDGLRFNRDSSTLVRTDRELVPGDVYDVESAMPTFDAADLRGADAEDAPDEIYLELPDDFPAAVRQQAMDIAASAEGPYDQARALQDWFRSEFEYSLEVAPGHSLSAIEAFLERRSGYCEQFAGTMAAMARSIGLPARVAVGFTPGVLGPDGVFRVTGRQAHAWPEIWFDGFGWVPFEPTPGRGAPGAENVTGVPPQQDAPPPPTTSAGETNPVDAGATTTTLAAAPPDAVSGAGPSDATPSSASTRDGGGWWRAVALVALVVAVVVALPALVRRARRRHGAADPAGHVADLWARARRAVEATTGTRLDPAQTPLEQAQQVAPKLPLAARPLRELAAVATAATYGPPELLTDDGLELTTADGPEHWCAEIETIAADARTPTARAREYFTRF